MGWVLAGIGLIAAGVILFVDRLDYWDAGEVLSDWWPVAIIALGVAQLAERPRPWFFAGLLVAAGGLLLLLTLDTFPDEIWDYFWPALFVAAGAWLLYMYVARRRPETTSESEINILAVLGEARMANTSPSFSGGTITSVLGDAEVDLRKATIAGDGAQVTATAVFGDTKVIVPHGWDVRVSALPIFGDVDNRTDGDAVVGPGAPSIVIRSVAVFGDVKVERR